MLGMDGIPASIETLLRNGRALANNRGTYRGQVAQVVERSPEKAGVGGSTPSLATIFQSVSEPP